MIFIGGKMVEIETINMISDVLGGDPMRYAWLVFLAAIIGGVIAVLYFLWPRDS